METTDFSTLTDEALAQAAWQYRREALHGHREAFGKAHEFERELRRRAGVLPSDLADFAGAAPAASPYAKPWWQRWALRGRRGSAPIDR